MINKLLIEYKFYHHRVVASLNTEENTANQKMTVELLFSVASFIVMLVVLLCD